MATCISSVEVTNGVAVFQRLMDKLVTDECLKDTSLISMTLLSLDELRRSMMLM